MIVLLNGPFGVGKSTTARLLAARLPGAVVYDPEWIGFVLRRLPLYRAADYQDLRLWRRLAVWGAWLARRALRRHLIVPLAVLRRDAIAELTAGFRRADPDARCLRLAASAETLRDRILTSGDRVARRWRLAHMAAGLAAADPAFGLEISTEGRTPAEVAEAIARLLRRDRAIHRPWACDAW